MATNIIQSMNECIDKGAEGIQRGIADTLFYHITAQCMSLLCPPYNREKGLACVVCTE